MVDNTVSMTLAAPALDREASAATRDESLDLFMRCLLGGWGRATRGDRSLPVPDPLRWESTPAPGAWCTATTPFRGAIKSSKEHLGGRGRRTDRPRGIGPHVPRYWRDGHTSNTTTPTGEVSTSASRSAPAPRDRRCAPMRGIAAARPARGSTSASLPRVDSGLVISAPPWDAAGGVVGRGQGARHLGAPGARGAKNGPRRSERGSRRSGYGWRGGAKVGADWPMGHRNRSECAEVTEINRYLIRISRM